jgi:3-oxoacyl-[acyl-carrier protein] reductase
VLVSSRSEDNLRAMVSANPSHYWIEWIAADVTDPDSASRLAETANERFGGLDMLVCNAGGPPPGDFSESPDEWWEDAFRLILLSPVRLVRACLPLLRGSGSGRIALISSVSAFRPVDRLVLSNTLRPALSGLARHLARELAHDNILINAVSPGFFDTDRSREVNAAIAHQTGRTPADVKSERTGRIPLQREGDPGELARWVAFALSQRNSYMTGQTLIVDGGLLQA